MALGKTGELMHVWSCDNMIQKFCVRPLLAFSSFVKRWKDNKFTSDRFKLLLEEFCILENAVTDLDLRVRTRNKAPKSPKIFLTEKVVNVNTKSKNHSHINLGM